LKLSKTGWLLIITGVVIIITAGLGVVRSQQIRQQNQLNEELALAQSRLNGIQVEPLTQRQAELEGQLSQTMAKAETARATLSQPLSSITLSDTLFTVAEDNYVEILEISSPGLGGEEVAGVTCSVLPLALTVSGNLTDLVSFITELNDNLATGVVRSVEINVPEMTSEVKPSVNIEMAIYIYKGV